MSRRQQQRPSSNPPTTSQVTGSTPALTTSGQRSNTLPGAGVGQQRPGPNQNVAQGQRAGFMNFPNPARLMRPGEPQYNPYRAPEAQNASLAVRERVDTSREARVPLSPGYYPIQVAGIQHVLEGHWDGARWSVPGHLHLNQHLVQVANPPIQGQQSQVPRAVPAVATQATPRIQVQQQLPPVPAVGAALRQTRSSTRQTLAAQPSFQAQQPSQQQSQGAVGGQQESKARTLGREEEAAGSRVLYWGDDLWQTVPASVTEAHFDQWGRILDAIPKPTPATMARGEFTSEHPRTMGRVLRRLPAMPEWIPRMTPGIVLEAYRESSKATLADISIRQGEDHSTDARKTASTNKLNMRCKRYRDAHDIDTRARGGSESQPRKDGAKKKAPSDASTDWTDTNLPGSANYTGRGDVLIYKRPGLPDIPEEPKDEKDAKDADHKSSKNSSDGPNDGREDPRDPDGSSEGDAGDEAGENSEDEDKDKGDDVDDDDDHRDCGTGVAQTDDKDTVEEDEEDEPDEHDEDYRGSSSAEDTPAHGVSGESEESEESDLSSESEDLDLEVTVEESDQAGEEMEVHRERYRRITGKQEVPSLYKMARFKEHYQHLRNVLQDWCRGRPGVDGHSAMFFLETGETVD
ncbi:MAG: hypothetical protein M1833_000093 [Piccolia ochrophora]|nr:MAG: hypothetical protein M1833_000093 [Piccolia ochrophora]